MQSSEDSGRWEVPVISSGWQKMPSARVLMSGRCSCLWALLRRPFRGSWTIFYGSRQPLLPMLRVRQTTLGVLDMTRGSGPSPPSPGRSSTCFFASLALLPSIAGGGQRLSLPRRFYLGISTEGSDLSLQPLQLPP